MKEFIKKFDIPTSADNYAIVNIPFITTIQSTGQNLRCAVKGKKIVVIDNVITIESESAVPYNEIWYTTTDGNPYPLEQIIPELPQIGATYNGPSVVSNEWNVDKQMFVMRFDGDVTVVGGMNLDTLAFDGPAFVTIEEFGMLCNAETIILPNSVTIIGYYAFIYCTNLTSINIPDGVTSIREEAFGGCASLTSINIPESVTSIAAGAFIACSSLTSITIPDGVTSIGEQAFSGCTSLTSVTINSDAIVNQTYSDSYNMSHIFGSQVSEYIIGDNVKGIGEAAFVGCTSLTSVTINSDAIVNQTYSDSYNMSRIFGSQVSEYIIGDNVKGIGALAFYECTSLTSITIPNSVTSIGGAAFGGCASLTSITIPDGVTSIGFLTFGGCTSLTSITIPNSVTSIGEWAFGSCTSLTSITIPVGVISIEKNAFGGCSSLQSITCLPTVPPILGGPSSMSNTNNCPIYVPAQSVDAYKTAANWSTYETRIQAIQ